MKTLTSTLIFLLVSQWILAQYSISGIVYDDQKQPLHGATIFILDLNGKRLLSDVSDTDGKYLISRINEKKVKIQVKYLGFENFEKTLDFSNDTKLELDVNLLAQPILEELVIKESKPHPIKASAKLYAAPNMDGSMNYNTFQSVSAPNFNTESYDHIQSNNFKSVKSEPLSTLSIDVDRASYSNVRRFITDGQMPPEDAVRIEEMINYFAYDYATPTNNNPLAVTSTYTTCPWNDQHQLVHIGMKSKEIDLSEAPANNLVFLLDVSGSMNSSDKLPLLKKGLSLLVDQMRPQDKVAIVVYAGAAGVVLEPTSGKHKDKILASLDQLSAGGSTAGGAGIKLAYQLAKDNFDKNGNNRVILATDGDFNVGASSDGEMTTLIESKRKEGIFLTVLGFGTGNLKDSKMEKLADHGNGNYAYIDNILEAKKTLVNEMGGTLITVAKDVKFQIEFNPTYVKEYRLIGYENRLLNTEDFNDDTKDAGELGAGHCVTAIYEIIPAGSEETKADIDPLKYQTEHQSSGSTGELLTVKVRYKLPKENHSTKLEIPLAAKITPFENTNEDIRFSIAVASYGMLLRNSEHKGKSSYSLVKTIARDAKGKDADGYRAAFVQMVDMTELLDKRNG